MSVTLPNSKATVLAVAVALSAGATATAAAADPGYVHVHTVAVLLSPGSLGGSEVQARLCSRKRLRSGLGRAGSVHQGF